MIEHYICIHGHFYQPPRENPWLEEVEFQESASPYHDWNEKVTAECYAPNAVSRIMDPQWRIIGLINNYSKISFNFGPTLLYWLEKHNKPVYQSILDADKESMKNFSGHGSAMAQVYNHMIMPLANRRDKETQVKWAIKDFEKRYGRYPEGMWLPETAVDIETLEVLAENKIKFTLLSPHQAAKTRKIGDKDWIEVINGKLEARRFYLCNLPSGKSINLFFFDKPTANDIAFGNLLNNGEAFAKRLTETFKIANGENYLENVASDGELYGHHHPHGDMTLAYCLYYITANNLAKITNYAEFLEKNSPPQFEIQIKENTSWSCIHGVERWRSDCGCNMGKRPWKQTWRKPLREAMDWLRNTLASNFEREAKEYLKDPWEARNDYIEVVLDRSKENMEKFLAEHAKKVLSEDDKRHVIKMLEIQRHAMLMYTSCGWFFDEISGLETVQVMMYAARAMQLAREVFGLELENEYINFLKKAPSNIPEFENGGKVYSIFVEPSVVDFAKISAQNTIMNLFSDQVKLSQVTQSANCYFTIKTGNIEKRDDGKFRLVTNRSKVYSGITLDEETFGCAAIWLGDHNVSCGALRNMQEEAFNSMRNEVHSCFEKGQINEIIVVLSKYFGQNNYSLKDLFKDDQRLILDFIVAGGLKKAKELFGIVYHDNSAMLRFMKENRVPSPRPFRTAAEIILNSEIDQALSSEDLDLEALQRLINNAKSLSINLDWKSLAFKASEKIDNEFTKLSEKPENIEALKKIESLVRTIKKLPMNLNLWQSQNVAFKIAKNQYRDFENKKDEASQKWILAFRQLCELIGVRLD